MHTSRDILRIFVRNAWDKVDRINEATKERDELNKKVKDLSELVVELTSRLNQGESQNQSVERVCTFPAADFHTQLHRLQGSMDNQSMLTINPKSFF